MRIIATILFCALAAGAAPAQAETAFAVAGKIYGLCSDYPDQSSAEACALAKCEAERGAMPGTCQVIFRCAQGGWGALASSPESDLVGMACGHFTTEHAISSAMRQCSEGGPNCAVDWAWQDFKGADPTSIPQTRQSGIPPAQ